MIICSKRIVLIGMTVKLLLAVPFSRGQNQPQYGMQIFDYFPKTTAYQKIFPQNVAVMNYITHSSNKDIDFETYLQILATIGQEKKLLLNKISFNGDTTKLGHINNLDIPAWKIMEISRLLLHYTRNIIILTDNNQKLRFLGPPPESRIITKIINNQIGSNMADIHNCFNNLLNAEIINYNHEKTIFSKLIETPQIAVLIFSRLISCNECTETLREIVSITHETEARDNTYLILPNITMSAYVVTRSADTFPADFKSSIYWIVKPKDNEIFLNNKNVVIITEKSKLIKIFDSDYDILSYLERYLNSR